MNKTIDTDELNRLLNKYDNTINRLNSKFNKKIVLANPLLGFLNAPFFMRGLLLLIFFYISIMHFIGIIPAIPEFIFMFFITRFMFNPQKLKGTAFVLSAIVVGILLSHLCTSYYAKLITDNNSSQLKNIFNWLF